MFINRWMDEENVVCILMEYHSTLKKKEILPLVTTWMKVKDIIQGK